MTDISVSTTAYQVERRDWLLSPHGAGPGTNRVIVLDVSAFTEAIHYPNGYIPSGCPLSKITASGLYGPYSVTDEVQTITEGGSGLTSFTLTFDGETTAAIPYNATAAQVKTALAGLDNVAASDITTTGGPLPGSPVVVTFAGNYNDTNVPQMTATASLTGGTSPTAAVSTTTSGVVGATATGFQAPEVNTDPNPNGVAIEAWSHAILNNAFAASLPYVHWVLPRAKLKPSEAMALGAEDPTQPVFEGTTEQNYEFGSGPLEDIAFPTGRVWTFNRVSTLPDLSEGLVEVTAGS